MTALVRYRNQTYEATLSSACLIGKDMFVIVTFKTGYKIPKQLHISHVKSFNVATNHQAAKVA